MIVYNTDTMKMVLFNSNSDVDISEKYINSEKFEVVKDSNVSSRDIKNANVEINNSDADFVYIEYIPDTDEINPVFRS